VLAWKTKRHGEESVLTPHVCGDIHRIGVELGVSDELTVQTRLQALLPRRTGTADAGGPAPKSLCRSIGFKIQMHHFVSLAPSQTGAEGLAGRLAAACRRGSARAPDKHGAAVNSPT
jgi:hypothetical protein